MNQSNLNWMPLLQKPSQVIENYVDQAQTVNIVETVLVGIAMMVGAALFTILFYWAYEKGDVYLLLPLYSFIVFLYVAKVIAFIVYIRSTLSPRMFQLYIGSGISMGLISLTVLIIFYTIYSKRNMSSSYSSLSQR